MLSHQRVDDLLKRYDKGTSRISLDKLGVGELNRAIRPKYVHAKLKRILEVEGFSAFRYKYAIGIEPADNDPHASTNRTNREADNSDGLLPKVGCQPRIGLLTKNHLLLGLLVL